MKKLLTSTLGLIALALIAAAVTAAGQQGGSAPSPAPEDNSAQARDQVPPPEQRFIPSREIGADRAVDFPADI